MHLIEHIIEPEKLLLVWQSSNEGQRDRLAVAELCRQNDNTVNLSYLVETEDFKKAITFGFTPYYAFPDVTKNYANVLDIFMRRLPPRAREDFSEYLESFRIKPTAVFSDFALLGYTGAKLLSDSFCLVHPFKNVKGACELLIEAAGFRHLLEENPSLNNHIQIGDTAHLEEKKDEKTQEITIAILVKNQLVGYIARSLVATFSEWIKNNRIANIWVEKRNGQPGKPTIYLYIQVSSALT